MRSPLLKRKTKLLLYKTLIRPVLTYAAETWKLTQVDEEALAVFERRVLRSILGGIFENKAWRQRRNTKLYRSFKEPDIVKFIKIQRIKRIGHAIRMEDRATKNIVLAKPTGSRPRGRPKIRFLDCLEKDFNTIRIKNWRTTAKNREPGTD